MISFAGARSFLSLPLAKKLQTCEFLLLTLFIRAGFRLWGVPATQSMVRKWAFRRRFAEANEPPEGLIRGLCGMQMSVTRRVGLTATCLVSSLALWAVLRRRGIDADLRVGIRRANGRVEGHAWVEWKGRPLNELPAVVDTYSAYPQPVAFDLWR